MPQQPGAAAQSLITPAGRQLGVACELAGERDADKDAHPHSTAPPSTERQVSAAADVDSQNLNGSSQSLADLDDALASGT